MCNFIFYSKASQARKAKLKRVTEERDKVLKEFKVETLH